MHQRNADRTYTGPKGSVPQQYSDELEDILAETLELLDRNRTVCLILEDMADINDHFQAVLDWCKARGNKLRHRYGQGCYMQNGMIYFVGADTFRPTRGVAKTFDLQEYAEELVRETGLEARLRKAGVI